MGYFPPVKRIVFLMILVLTSGSIAVAQQGIYVPKKGKIYFVGDTATVFSNVINNGKLGVGKKAVLNFKGKKWENDPEALITDDAGLGDTALGEGGIIIFNNDTVRQQIDGGYNQVTRTGAEFSRIHINNPNGVELINSTTRIRSTLHFTRGLFFLKNNMLVIGNKTPGIISGYDAGRFIVTGSANSGGALIRENIRATDGMVHFPVGSKATSYAPAAIRSYVTTGDDYYVTVFDTVLSNATSGRILNDISVNKTWQIGKLQRPNQDKVEIYLQHDLNDEGASFYLNRSSSFISKHTGSGWDTAYPQTFPVAGSIITGPVNNSYGLNSRTMYGSVSSGSWFTKFSVKSDTINKTKLWFYAYRVTWSSVSVYWKTNPEINNHYFVVQRRFGSDTAFKNTDTVYTKAPAGISWSDLNYAVTDPNSFEGITYYRLMMVDYAGNSTYSNVIPVGNRPGGSGAIVWPNPNRGRFFAGINGDTRIQAVVIYTVLGQKIHEEKVNGRNIIELIIRMPGTYMVSFVGISGNFIDTKKVVIPVVN